MKLPIATLPLLFAMAFHGGVLRGQAVRASTREPVENAPVADYLASPIRSNSSVPAGPFKRPAIAELTDGRQMLPVNVHWWRGLDALPFGSSDLVIDGVVTSAKAVLSIDRSEVNSEFTVKIKANAD